MVVRRILLAAAFAAFVPLGTPAPATAQDEAQPWVYGVYMTCNLAQGARINELIMETWAPYIEPHVEAGHLTSWGLLTHVTGGEWTKVLYHAGPDRNELLGALDEAVQGWVTEEGEAFEELWNACSRHEDYVWQRVMGSQSPEELGAERPAYGMSTYWVCDSGRGALIDLLAETVMAPAMNAQVEAGNLNSWGWMAHRIGGKFRRLLVSDAATQAGLLDARQAVIEQINEEHPQLIMEFNAVCNSHDDYVWTIDHSGS